MAFAGFARRARSELTLLEESQRQLRRLRWLRRMPRPCRRQLM